MKKGLLVLITLVGPVFLSLLPVPREYFPLTEQRLREALSDYEIFRRVGFSVSGTFKSAFPGSFRINEGKEPALFHRRCSLSIDRSEGKFGVSGFMEGPAVTFPVDLAKRKLRTLIETALETNMLDIESRKAENFDPEIIRISISYSRPKDPRSWMREVERKIIALPVGDKRVEKFLRLWDREVLSFTELALKKYPPQKVHKDKERPERFSLVTKLTEKEAEEVEKELQKNTPNLHQPEPFLNRANPAEKHQAARSSACSASRDPDTSRPFLLPSPSGENSG